jgi:hypothetical protein
MYLCVGVWVGLFGQSNRLAKVALARCDRIVRQQHAPFLAYELLYLRRDMAHMGAVNLGRLLEQLDALHGVRRRAPTCTLRKHGATYTPLATAIVMVCAYGLVYAHVSPRD